MYYFFAVTDFARDISKLLQILGDKECDNVALVVSPLHSLMMDQLATFERHKIKAYALMNHDPVYSNFPKGLIYILYITHTFSDIFWNSLIMPCCL